MPLQIEDAETVALVTELANARGMTQSEAVRAAVAAELGRVQERKPLRERLADLRARHPLPPPAGLKADKAFFDSLNDE